MEILEWIGPPRARKHLQRNGFLQVLQVLDFIFLEF